MKTSVDRRGDVVTVHIAGSVDGLTAEGLQQVFTGVRKVLDLSGLTRILSVFEAVDGAVRSFGGRG